MGDVAEFTMAATGELGQHIRDLAKERTICVVNTHIVHVVINIGVGGTIPFGITSFYSLSLSRRRRAAGKMRPATTAKPRITMNTRDQGVSDPPSLLTATP